MCGIFGATDLKTFIELYNFNKVRGAKGCGFLIIEPDKHFTVIRYPEDVTLKPEDLPQNGLVYLGHVKAPTGSEASRSEIHPLQAGDIYAAHNGIIHNHLNLRSIYNIPEKPYTDSFVIPYLISQIGLKETLDVLDGIFAIWLFDSLNFTVKLFRNVSSVYYGTNTFSSIKNHLCPNELTAGTIVSFPDLKTLDIFEYDSPYYIPEN